MVKGSSPPARPDDGNDHSGKAYDIVKRFSEAKQNEILLQLKKGLTAKQLAKGQKPARIPVRRAQSI